MCSKIMCGKYVNYMYCTFDVHLMKHAKNLIILRKHILENVQLKETHIYLMLFFTLLASFLIMNYMALKVLRKFIDCWQTFFGNWSSEVKFSENAESEVSSKCEPGLVQINIGHTCLIILHCAFLNIFSNCLPLRMQSKIGCIYSTFPHV